jgi:hypothetical protein
VLTYLGRGDFAEDFDFDDCYTRIADTFHRPRREVEHIVRKIPFADYLQAGLDHLAGFGLDVDRLL